MQKIGKIQSIKPKYFRLLKELKVIFHNIQATKRTEGISTTDIIGKILKDRHKYLKRNVDRGMTR